MNAIESHKSVLAVALKRVSRSVLELGAGDCSTPLIHSTLEGRNVKVLTVDDDHTWLSKYEHLKTEFHDFKCISHADIQKFYDNDNEPWELVFVDSGSWEARAAAIKKYREIADYLVIHDCNYLPENGIFGKILEPMHQKTRRIGKRDYSDVFKYWIEFSNWASRTELNPFTLIASNKINLRNFKVRRMTISGRS